MKFCRMLLASFAACVSLISCGGGGGGDATSSATGQAVNSSSGGWLTFSPSVVNLTVYQGEPVTFSVIANSSKTIAEKINIGVVDAVGLITPNVRIVANTKTNYTATFNTSPSLPVGVHNSVLQVRICFDEPSICKQPYTDSPWQVPIRINVLPATNLTPLTKLDGDRPWGTVNGNNSHNAYFSGPVSPGNFTRRWSVQSWRNAQTSDFNLRSNPSINISGDSIISSIDAGGTIDTGIPVGYLRSQREFDGGVNWDIDLVGGFSTFHYPSVSEDRLMVLSVAGSAGADGRVLSGLRSYNLKTGQLLGQGGSLTFFGVAPFYSGNSIFLGGAFQGKAEISRSDVHSGVLTWRTVLGAGRFGDSTPAVDSRYVYAFRDPQATATGSVGGQLVGLDAATGEIGLNILVPGTKSQPVFQQAPVLGSNGMVFVESGADAVGMGVSNKLLAFDTGAKTLKWTLTGNYRSNPVDAAGTLFVLNGYVLEARKPADGKLLWSWPIPDHGLGGTENVNIVVVGNLVFLCARTSTHAVDVTTHQSVWSYPHSGYLAVSDNGILYIRSYKTVAINLR